ncbi:hypothetical protein ACXHP8_22580 [Vibrio antiquarius]
MTLLNLRIVRLSTQKRFLVLLIRFLRRCMFYVVSLSSRFEIAPDFNASKHIAFDVRKVQIAINQRLGLATNKRFKTDSQRVAFVVCGKFSDLGGVRKHRIALLTT